MERRSDYSSVKFPSLLIGFALLFALNPPALGAAATPEQTTEILQLRDQLIKALHDGDAKTLDSLLADDFLFVHSTGTIATKDQFIARAVSMAKGDADVTLKFLENNLRMYGDSVAVLVTRSIRHNPERNEDLLLQGTDVILKRDGRWQWVSVQSSRLPPAPAKP